MVANVDGAWIRRWPAAWLLALAACGPTSPQLLPPTDVNIWAMRAGGPVNRFTEEVGLDLPPDWIFEPGYRDRQLDLAHPIGLINVRDRQRNYWGSIAIGDARDRVDDGRPVWREAAATPIDAVTLARWHLQWGVARGLREATIQPTRVDGREAAIITGLADRVSHSPGGADAAIAVVPGPDFTHIVTLMSRPGLLGHTPTMAYSVLAACRLNTTNAPAGRLRDGFGFRGSEAWRWTTDVLDGDDFGFAVHGKVEPQDLDVYVIRTSKRSFPEHMVRWTRDGVLEAKSDPYSVADVHLGGRVLEGQGAKVWIGNYVPLTGSFYVLEEKGASYLVMIQYPRREVIQQPDARPIDFPAVRAMLANNIILP